MNRATTHERSRVWPRSTNPLSRRRQDSTNASVSPRIKYTTRPVPSNTRHSRYATKPSQANTPPPPRPANRTPGAIQRRPGRIPRNRRRSVEATATPRDRRERRGGAEGPRTAAAAAARTASSRGTTLRAPRPRRRSTASARTRGIVGCAVSWGQAVSLIHVSCCPTAGPPPDKHFFACSFNKLSWAVRKSYLHRHDRSSLHVWD